MPVRKLRLALVLTTVLCSPALLVSPAAAQNLPTGASVGAQSGSDTVTFGTSGTTGTLNLGNNQQTLVNWNSFDVASGYTMQFQYSGAGQGAVLNRVIGGNFSNIAGNLLGPNNLNVFLINPNGILFGPGANVNVGGLIASTLDLADADFMNGSAYNFTGTATTGVTVASGATIQTGSGPLVLLGGMVSNSGALSGGDVVMAAASDVSMALAAGSPLSMTINQGTPIGGTVVDAGGTIDGTNVYLALASRSGVVDALLNVSGTVTATTATATDRGIVLAAGASGSGVTVASGGGNDTGGPGRVDISGSLTASGAASSAANVEVRARGNVTGSGAINAADSVAISSAAGDVTLTGSDAIDSGSGIDVMALGSVGIVNADTAAGDLQLTGSSLSLTNSSLSAANGNLTLTGPVSVTGTSVLSGGNVTVNNMVDASAPGAGSVTVNSPGITTFNGTIGGVNRLSALSTNAGGSTVLNGGTVATTGGQSYLDALVLGANTTIINTSPQDILFGSTIDGPYSLAVNSGTGNTIFNGAVGGTAALTALATNAAGATEINGGLIRTIFGQYYGDPVVIGANADLVSTGGGSLNLQTVNGAVADAYDLSLETMGNVITGQLGGTTALDGLAIRAGTATLSGGPHRVNMLAANVTAGGLAFTNSQALTVGTVDGLSGITTAGTVTITAASVDLQQGIDSGTANVSLGASSGAVIGSGLIEGNIVSVSGVTGIGSSGTRVNTAATSLVASSGSGAVYINEADAVTASGTAATRFDVTAGGSITTPAVISVAGGDVVLTATGAGSDITLNADILAGGGGDVRLTADDMINRGGAATLVGEDLHLTAGDFSGGIFGSAALQETNNVAITDTSGSLFISAATDLSAQNGLTVTTTSGQLSVGGVSAPGFITLNSAQSLALTDNIAGGGGLVTLTAGTTISQSAGVITAGLLGGSAVGSAHLSQSNNVTALGNFAANGFSLTNAGALQVSGAVSGGAGGVTLLTGGDLTLTAPASIASSNGPIALTALGAASDILLNGAINAGSGTLTANAGAAISQSAGGVITAGLLQGGAGTFAGFNGVDNQVASLGNFTTGTAGAGGFLLINGGSLSTVTGTTVNTNNSALELRTLNAGADLSLAGTLNAGSAEVTLGALGASGDIAQSGGAIIAATLTGQSAGSTSLTSSAIGGNSVGSLGAFTANGFSFAQDGGISVNGAVSGGTGGLTLSSLNGGIAVNAAGSLNSAGLIDVDAGGSIIVDGVVNGATAVDLQAAGQLSIVGSGQVGSSGSVRLASTGGAVAIGGAGASALGTLDLDSASGVTQTATISAGTLTGTNGGAVVLLNAGNAIGTLGAFQAAGFRLRDSGNLNIAGAVNIGAGTFELVSAGSIDQQPGSVITAGTLTGSAGGFVQLDSANNITNLGTFSADSLSLGDAGGLTITGTVDAWAGDATIRTAGGDLVIGAGATVNGANVLLSTDQDFINNRGTDAIGASARWLVYSASPAGNIYGGLDSGNAAVWNATYGSLDPATISGNHYVFAYQPTLTVTTVDASKVYGTDLTGSTGSLYTISGLHAGIAGAFLGDTAASAFSGAPLISSAGLDAEASVAGGPYAVTASAGTMTSLNGYAIAFDNGGAITVTPKALTAIVTANDKTYDGTTAATGSITLDGVLFDDQVTASALLAFADENAGSNKIVSISGGSLSGADAGNYTLNLPASVLADIFQKAITGTVIADDKIYDGTSSATGSVSLTGVIAGDHVTASAILAFANANAGSDKTVTISGGSLSGADAGNYTLTLPASTLANIFRKAITGTVVADDKIYDGTTDATGTITLNGVVLGDEVTASVILAFLDKNAGTDQAVTVSGATLGGADADNYTLTLPASVLADIFQKAIGGTVIADDKIYDGTTDATGTVTLNGVVVGDDVSASAVLAFLDKNAGADKAVTVSGGTLAGADAGNYTLTLPSSVLAEIFRKALTATVDANDKTYDGDTAASGTVTLNGTVAGDEVSASAILAFADKNAGDGKVVNVSGGSLSGADAGNYTLTLPTSTLASITPKALTGAVVADDKIYDGTTSASGNVTLDGVIIGDEVTAAALLAFADKNAGSNKVVTISGGSLSGADAGNYTLNLPASVLADIFQRAITGTVIANDKTYDGTTAATGSVTLDGVIAGDSVTASAILAFVDANAGSDKIVTISGGGLSGADAGNYRLTLPASTLADIFKRAITVTANPAVKGQGEEDPTLTYAITAGSLVGGDSLTGGLVREAGELPGDYAITQGTLAASGNYDLTFVGSTLTVDPQVKFSDQVRGLLQATRPANEPSDSPLIIVDRSESCEDSNASDAQACSAGDAGR